MLPLPSRDDLELDQFWAGTELGEVRVQRCLECDTFRWPPRPTCPSCVSLNTKWVTTQGEGKLFTWTIVARTNLPDFIAETPYVVGVVELNDVPVRLIGQILVENLENVRVGLELKAEFRAHKDGVTLVCWRVSG